MTDLPPVPPGRIIRATDAARWRDAYAVLESARSKAAALVGAAEAEVEAARRQGYADGRQEGVAEAERLVAAAREEAAAYLAGLEDSLVELVFAIAGRLLDGFDDRLCVAAAVRPALAAFCDERAISITVAPAMVPHVEALAAEAGVPGQQIEVRPDRHLGGRQCLVASASGSIDAGLDTQLARMQGKAALAPAGTPR